MKCNKISKKIRIITTSRVFEIILINIINGVCTVFFFIVLRIKNKEIYDFYKENIKFTEFFLESVFSSEKGLIKKFKDKFNNQ
ncbi:plasmid partition family protein (plasmid) [Borreliella andersonii]|uniref:Plasmid partition family protein n=1 Tax=Borrelia andersonii TaxID=42109 RepID=A0ACD5G6M7_BORAD